MIAVIKQAVAEHSGITFCEYMQRVLYEPKLGYYQAGSTKFGAPGDFVTAPEISPLFAYALANQCADIMRTLPQASLLEFGAGSGLLARDILLNLQRSKCLPDHYFIVEVSADLVERQRQTLQDYPDLLSRVQWLSSLPKDFCGVVLANEVLDAMPVELFSYHSGEVYQGGVQHDKGEWGLSWQLKPDQWLPTHVHSHKHDWVEGYMSEFNPVLPAWLQVIEQSLLSGVVLLIDYGYPATEYYHPDRQLGTLMCHYRHYAHPDPFLYPGMQDITAHVDFTAVAHAADTAGLQVAGFTSQANFLLACGILDGIAALSERDRVRESQQLQMLLMPSEMGELFKVMALTKGFQSELLGFSTRDQRYRL